MNAYKKIAGFFPKINADILDGLIKEYDIKHVIEIGAFVGKSTVFFAERCESVLTIDTFDAHTLEYIKDPVLKREASNQWDNFVENTKEFHEKIVAMKGKSADLAEIIAPADMVFIDGSHKYDDVREDIMKYLPKANRVICGDDYSPRWHGVRRAVDELLPAANKEQRLWFNVINRVAL